MLDYQEQANELYKGAALAPMVRASTTPLRALALQYGADFVYTEELVDRSITLTTRVENSELGTIDYIKDTSQLSAKTQRKLAKEGRPCLLLRLDPTLEISTKKLVCQLGTGEPELALAAAKHVYRDMAAIDINMGCPKKFSVSGGMGSALLNDPDRAQRILRTLRTEIPRPISCKIRLLETTQKTLDFVEGMINAGANAVAIHARTVGHDATHKADWDTLKECLGLLRPKYPNFPFLVNGDFYDRQELDDCLEATKASGVLLGRPALYNTSIFRKLPLPLVDKSTVIQEYLQSAVRYDIHYKNTKYVICEMMNNRRAPTERVPYLPQAYEGGQTIAKTCNCQNHKEMCQVWNVEWSQANYLKSSVQALAPGEHRYEDSYFLTKQQKRRDENGDVAITAAEQPEPKRMKTCTDNGGKEEVKEENGSNDYEKTKDKKNGTNKESATTKDVEDSTNEQSTTTLLDTTT